MNARVSVLVQPPLCCPYMTSWHRLGRLCFVTTQFRCNSVRIVPDQLERQDLFSALSHTLPTVQSVAGGCFAQAKTVKTWRSIQLWAVRRKGPVPTPPPPPHVYFSRHRENTPFVPVRSVGSRLLSSASLGDIRQVTSSNLGRKQTTLAFSWSFPVLPARYGNSSYKLGSQQYCPNTYHYVHPHSRWQSRSMTTKVSI